MATTKPPRKTAIQPTAPALAKERKAEGATTFAATSRTEVHEKPRKTGGRPPQTVRTSGPDSAQLVADVRSGLGVTRELFARLTGFSVRAITDWEAGRPISESGLRRVKEWGRLACRARRGNAGGVHRAMAADTVRGPRGPEAGRGPGARRGRSTLEGGLDDRLGHAHLSVRIIPLHSSRGQWLSTTIL